MSTKILRLLHSAVQNEYVIQDEKGEIHPISNGVKGVVVDVHQTIVREVFGEFPVTNPNIPAKNKLMEILSGIKRERKPRKKREKKG